ncbi:MAG: biotin-dependent carboxyltransferase family protein [Pseudomonadota bacterium]
MIVEVLRPGLGDLVMDAGRPGWRRLGVPAGGAADRGALAAANRLVGNPPEAAGLEIVGRGPYLHFPRGGVIALTGAPFRTVRAAGLAAGWNQTLVLAAEEILRMGEPEAGYRCWLAVRGGLAVVPVLGSASTLPQAGWGGHHGRPLRTGDVLHTGKTNVGVHLMRAHPAVLPHDAPVRVVAGPQSAAFTDEGLAAFVGGAFRVDPASDRRGIRLAGPRVASRKTDWPTQGVLPGAIQVPPDGQPIILGWDGPVTGGYPVIATVIDADLPRLAQLRPGATLRFETVSVEAARAVAPAAWELSEWG